jgi:hypothetical protein
MRKRHSVLSGTPPLRQVPSSTTFLGHPGPGRQFSISIVARPPVLGKDHPVRRRQKPVVVGGAWTS